MEHEIVDFLSTLVDEQHLFPRAMDGYQLWLADDPDDLPAQIQLADVQGVFRSQTLCFKHAELSYPYIDTRLDLVAHGEVVGYYRLITLLDGTDDDDYFVLAGSPRRRRLGEEALDGFALCAANQRSYGPCVAYSHVPTRSWSGVTVAVSAERYPGP